MKKIHKLTWQELKHSYPPFDLGFKTTDELEYLDELIGQERAKKAIEFGLSVEASGYNIYISGEPGTGKVTLAKQYAQKLAKQREIPKDWCYVYNFKDQKVPVALCFEPGEGKKFRDDMIELIEYLSQEIPYMYQEKEYLQFKDRMVENYQKEKQWHLSQLKQYARELDFALKVTNDGIAFSPLGKEGLPFSEEGFEALSPNIQVEIDKKSKKMQKKVKQVLDVIKELEEKIILAIENLEYDMALKNIGYYIKILKERYGSDDKVKEYLDDLQQDILDNIQIFIEEESENKPAFNLLPWMKEKSVNALTSKYKVNLLVDHSSSQGAPVIIDLNASYNKIVGKIEYDNEFGTLSADYMKIKPGLFHKANGGYLILQAEDILVNYGTWDAIKQIIKKGKIFIENPQDINVMTVATLNPEPIKIDVKVILIGSARVYEILYKNDDEFKGIFKIQAAFDKEMYKSLENSLLLARFIKTYGSEQSLMPFTKKAVETIIEYSSRYVESRKKITTEFGYISNIMIEANAFAKRQNKILVDENHIHLAIEEKRNRSCYYEDKLQEKILNNEIMIETKGRQVGQVNGLAIYDVGEYCFGKPIKITATTYQGQLGIVNIEKESKLSGNIHIKASHIIKGYLGQTYAQESPISLSCHICYEQSYGRIDGDSASSAEIYAILSSLSDIGLNQSFAVTGSINQRGLIQPVGGVTHKIEGFYKVCKERGLTGSQGVIIPKQNILDLVLEDEIIKAVRNNKFHIYAISTIEEGLEILSGMPYEIIHEKVKDKFNKINILNNQ